jgi:hypothetical protein
MLVILIDCESPLQKLKSISLIIPIAISEYKKL